MPRHKTLLTPKEQIFVSEVIKTKGNKTEAAFRAYDTKSRRNAQLIANRVVKKPHVREAIEKAFTKLNIDPEWLLEQEKEIIIQGIKQGKPTMTDARMSIQNLHKLFNSYPDKVNKSLSLSVREKVNSEDTSKVLEQLQKLTEVTNSLIQDINK